VNFGFAAFRQRLYNTYLTKETGFALLRNPVDSPTSALSAFEPLEQRSRRGQPVRQAPLEARAPQRPVDALPDRRVCSDHVGAAMAFADDESAE
jgi:hypothetical protein